MDFMATTRAPLHHIFSECTDRPTESGGAGGDSTRVRGLIVREDDGPAMNDRSWRLRLYERAAEAQLRDLQLLLGGAKGFVLVYR